MPRYSWDIKDILFEEDVNAMFQFSNRVHDRVLIALLWLFPVRPQEIAPLYDKEIMSNRPDFGLRARDLVYTPDKLEITIKTLKRNKKSSKAFDYDRRTLVYKRGYGVKMNVYVETLIAYVEKLKPEDLVLQYTTRWQEGRINDISEAVLKKRLCPYHFRHSVMTLAAKNGATIPELMQMKGAKDPKSVMPYLQAVPFVINLERQRRGRDISGSDMGMVDKPQDRAEGCSCDHERKLHYFDGGCALRGCPCLGKGDLMKPPEKSEPDFVADMPGQAADQPTPTLPRVESQSSAPEGRA